MNGFGMSAVLLLVAVKFVSVCPTSPMPVLTPVRVIACCVELMTIGTGLGMGSIVGGWLIAVTAMVRVAGALRLLIVAPSLAVKVTVRASSDGIEVRLKYVTDRKAVW